MRKYNIPLIILLMINYINAQSFQNNYLGSEFSYYKGVLFKIDPKDTSGYKHIYLSRKELISNSNESNHKITININELIDGQTYRVDSIIDLTDQYFLRRIDGVSIMMNPYFVLKNINNNQKIYFKYNQHNEKDFPFLTSEILLDEKSVLNTIRTQKSITNDTVFRYTTFTDVYKSPMLILKEVKTKTQKNYILLVTIFSSEKAMKGNSIKIKFEDCRALKRKVPISGFADLNKNLIYCSIPMNNSEIKKLKNNLVTQINLNGNVVSLNRFESIRFNAGVKIMTKT